MVPAWAAEHVWPVSLVGFCVWLYFYLRSPRSGSSPDHLVIESYLLDMDRILTDANKFALPGGARLAPKWERDVASVLLKYLPDTDYLAYFAAGKTLEEKVRHLLQIAGWERRWPARR